LIPSQRWKNPVGFITIFCGTVLVYYFLVDYQYINRMSLLIRHGAQVCGRQSNFNQKLMVDAFKIEFKE
ncbi:MAG: hypothetical protein WD431_00590, partial [Cyclobacteriaceae bacterium]